MNNAIFQKWILIPFIVIPSLLIGQNYPYKALHNHDGRVNRVAFSPDSRLLASGGQHQALVINDLGSREANLTIKEHFESVKFVDFSYDGKYVFSASSNVLLVVDVEANNLAQKLTNFTGIASMLASYDPDKLFFVAKGKTDDSKHLFQLNWGTGFIKTVKTSAHIEAYVPSSDGKFIFVSVGKEIEMIDLETMTLAQRFAGHSGKIKSMDYNQATNHLISASNTEVISWDVEKVQPTPFTYKKVKTVKWAPDGNYFIMSIKNTLLLREAGSLKDLEMFTGTVPVEYFEISPDGRHIALAAQSEKVKLYESPWAPEEEIVEVKTEKEDLAKETNKTQPKEEASKLAQTMAGAALGVSIPVLADLNSDVDKDIPESPEKKELAYALIIGNEDYSTYQMDLTNEVNVDFALNDAIVFNEYATRTLGVPEDNVILLLNARAIEMHRAVEKIGLIIKNAGGEAEVIFYYAGHGFPDEITKEPYLIPVDVGGSDLQFAVKLKDVYDKFTAHQSKRVTVFLDACFSGGARNQGLLAARGVRIKPKQEMISENLVVFSASSGDQSSLPWKDKQHGLFTYYLLKKMQESGGELTYGELSSYIIRHVGLTSVMENNKEQNPQVNVSPSMQGTWEDMNLK